MSHIKTHAKKNKPRKGISPVIATVILVAVAVVIAAALAGFSSSLFGSYSQGSQITIRSVEVNAGADTGSLQVVNKGGAPETITKISAAGFTDATITPGTEVVAANSEQTVLFDSMNFGAGDEGKTITMTVQTQSGQTYTLSTVVKS
jgi:flagellin-like protein